ncbi:helix-turn-helix domain-containing protein [Streptomyces sp. NPDC020917]|uniref:helix-turn-helix domain-containing protein n=1 Tax=Streptomyces sp. NPDC020917 TaxID=3365102 RepID=UPI0037AEBFD4
MTASASAGRASSGRPDAAADSAPGAPAPSARRASAGQGGAAPDPFTEAVKPLADAIGAALLAPAEARGDDVVLSWEGEPVVAVRLPHLADSLDHILADLERRHGPLPELGRKEKQNVVRILEERGAFSVRHGVETVASALGVSRFTVYNYLNRENAARDER